MPIDNTLKKMILFSSLPKRKTIEGLVKDFSAESGRSESAVIEQSLEQALMPADANARYWITSLYNGGSLSDAYINVFSGYAAGLNWQSRWSNGRPLVEEFSRNLAMTFPVVTGKEDEIYHLRSQINTIFELLPNCPDNQEEKVCWNWYIDQMRDNPKQVSLFDFTSLILRSWNWVGNHTATYRALVDVCKIARPNFCNDSRSRLQFVHIIRQLSTEWDKS